MQWYERSRGRVMMEASAVKKRYPQFVLKRLKDGSLAWYGYLQTSSRSDTLGKRYYVQIVYPPSFPSQPPSSYVEGISGVETTPHQFSDGRLCLFYPDDSKQWTSSSTAVVVITWTAGWLHAYEVWKKTGSWPGRAR